MSTIPPLFLFPFDPPMAHPSPPLSPQQEEHGLRHPSFPFFPPIPCFDPGRGRALFFFFFLRKPSLFPSLRPRRYRIFPFLFPPTREGPYFRPFFLVPHTRDDFSFPPLFSERFFFFFFCRHPFSLWNSPLPPQTPKPYDQKPSFFFSFFFSRKDGSSPFPLRM